MLFLSFLRCSQMHHANLLHDTCRAAWPHPSLPVQAPMFMCKNGHRDVFTDSSFIDCLYLCRKAGARVINYSYGGTMYSQVTFDAIKKMQAHKVLLVTAAGNSGNDIDVNPFYPAAYKLDNIISGGSCAVPGVHVVPLICACGCWNDALACSAVPSCC